MERNNSLSGLGINDKLSKAELRKNILNERRRRAAQTIEILSNKITDRLISWEEYNLAKSVMLYVPMPDEPQIDDIFNDAWAKQKIVSVPHLTATWGIMEAAQINSFQDLVPGKIKNLKVPAAESLCIINAEKIDFVLIPGIAFDHHGYRLGMGAGYYDRFLPKAFNAVTVGVCWSDNVAEKLPHAEHDVPVQFLLTDLGILNCNKGKM